VISRALFELFRKQLLHLVGDAVVNVEFRCHLRLFGHL
jgi:hypothetical protein